MTGTPFYIPYKVSLLHLPFFFQTLLNTPLHYNTNAPINVNPVGGECRQGVGIWQILKFFDQIPQGGKRKVNQKCQKSPHPREKNLNKQYYDTV